jgi:hypothetical protein
MVVFSIYDVLGRKIDLSEKRYKHILTRPEMKGQESRIKDTLKNPNIIKESNHSKDVLLYS